MMHISEFQNYGFRYEAIASHSHTNDCILKVNYWRIYFN